VPFPPAEKENAIVPQVHDAPPRYVDTPPPPLTPIAKRNLIFGIVFLVLAALGLWLGLYYAGAMAARTLIASVGACGLVLLFAKRRVLSQQHGILLVLGAAALFGAAIPWVEGTFRKLDGIARENLADGTEKVAHSVPPPPPTLENAPPAPPTIPLPAEESEPTPTPKAEKKPVLVMRKGPAEATPASDDTDKGSELVIPELSKDVTSFVELQADMAVDFDGRVRIIRAGTRAPFKQVQDEKVLIVAGDHEVFVGMDFVKFKGKSKESPAELTKMARREAQLRYPKLADPDSQESEVFALRQKELEIEPDGREFLKNPNWPLILAEQIAKEKSWVRGDEETPAEKSDDPTSPGGSPEIPPASSAPSNFPIPANEAPGQAPPRLDEGLPPLPPELPATPQHNAPVPRLKAPAPKPKKGGAAESEE
jgi:hypothetical protein